MESTNGAQNGNGVPPSPGLFG